MDKGTTRSWIYIGLAINRIEYLWEKLQISHKKPNKKIANNSAFKMKQKQQSGAITEGKYIQIPGSRI